jgi:uncharacterized protein
MKHGQPEALRLDVAAFAAAAGELAGQWSGESLTRLAEMQVPPQDQPLPVVQWQVHGKTIPVAGSEPELWLALQVGTSAWLTCQRCLQPMEVALTLDRRLRFVRGEAQAEALDAEIEDDVLALTRQLDLRELVEDELLLALPIVPRHARCPKPLPMALALDEPGDDAASARPNPFEALRMLKTDKPGGDPT